MNISTNLIRNLIRAARTQSELDSVLKYSNYRDCYYAHMLCNEAYFIQKLNDNDLKKRTIYESLITSHSVKELDYMLNAINKAKYMKFDPLYVESIQIERDYKFMLEDFGIAERDMIDDLINAALIFQEVYLNYRLPKQKVLFAQMISNAYLQIKGHHTFTTFISEAIFSNLPKFNQAILDQDAFINFYLQLVYAQNHKTLDRIKATDQLIEANEVVLSTYGDNIVDYLYTHSMFSITNFVESVNVSYNTAKKYLRNLVDEGILRSVKVGKHNAFIYDALYTIWNR